MLLIGFAFMRDSPNRTRQSMLCSER